MRFPNRTELERLCSEYPVGCRIVLDEMDDPYRQMPAGLQGVCRGVDDAGNILVSWDNGSSLNVAYGAARKPRRETGCWLSAGGRTSRFVNAAALPRQWRMPDSLSASR